MCPAQTHHILNLGVIVIRGISSLSQAKTQSSPYSIMNNEVPFFLAQSPLQLLLCLTLSKSIVFPEGLWTL